MFLGTVVLIGVLLASPLAGASVTGRVVAENGLPLGGATVSVYDHEGELARAERRMAGRPQTALATAKAAADGSFTIEPGRKFVWLQAEAAGYMPVRQGLLDDMAPMVVLQPAPLKRGVITAGGKPVAGAVVVWTSYDGAELISRTGADGAYEAPYPRLSGGKLLVLHPDFAPRTAPEPERRPMGGLDLNQELDAGTPVAGTVVDYGSGRPVADAQVWIDGQGPLATTDAAGVFRVRAPREWRILTARAPRLIGTANRGDGALVVRLELGRSLAGMVQDGVTGEPVAGATVLAWRNDGGPTGGTATDARGRYAIASLPPGQYVLRIEHPGFAWVNATGPDREGLDLLHALSARLDVALQPVPRLRGQVEDERGRPVEGAVVFCGQTGAPALYGRTAPFTGTGYPAARTGPNGSFTLRLSEYAGSLQSPRDPGASLVALHPGYAAGRLELPRRGLPEAPLLIKMSRGVELGGRVALPDGTPAAGVAVTLVETGLTIRGVATHSELANLEDAGWTTTDAAGRFSVRVHPVAHDLSFRKAGLAPKIVQGQQPHAGHELLVTLEAPLAIRGRVSRADGRGVPSVEVSVSQFPRQEPKQAFTAADGTFELRGLAPGRYQLLAQHAELGIRESRTVEAPANVAIVLQPRGILRGRVVDAATGKPVPRFEVWIHPQPPTQGSGGQLHAQGAAGAFTIPEAPVGTFTAEVIARGYLRTRLEGVTVTAGPAASAVEIALPADTPIRGRVTDGDGRPVGKAAVSVTPEEGTRMALESGDDGRFEARGFPPGEAVLEVRAAGFLAETRAVDTRRAAAVDVVLSRGLSLEGIVVRDGAGVAGATVAALASGSHVSEQEASTDEHGRFQLTGLRRGRYRVRASDRDDVIVLQGVDVEHASPLRLVLGEVASVSGKVVGLPPADDQEVRVWAAQEAGRSFSETVDEDQSFRFDRLPPGRVEIYAGAQTATVSRSSRKVELTLKPGEAAELTIEFPPGVTVSGRVVCDGQPVPGARVYFRGDSGSGVGGAADARGIYEVAGLEPGRYTVRAGTDHRPGIPMEHTVTAGGQLDIDITTAGVSGRVVRADTGAPVRDARVSITRVGAGTDDLALHTTTMTEDQGSFVALELAPGRYRVATAKPGFAPEQREVELPRGKKVEVVIELRAAAAGR